jgi:DNA-directed RNA polymerase specialized sigma24 family protein
MKPLEALLWEKDLMTRCARHEPQAWSILIERYGPMIDATIRHYLGNAAVKRRYIEDLRQDVFVELLARGCKRLRNFDPARGAHAGWYFHLIVHKVVSRWQRKGIGRPKRVRLDAYPQQHLGSEDFSERQALSELEEELTEPQRACVQKEIGEAPEDCIYDHYAPRTQRHLRQQVREKVQDHAGIGAPPRRCP